MAVVRTHQPLRSSELEKFLPDLDHIDVDVCIRALMRANKVSLTAGYYDLVERERPQMQKKAIVAIAEGSPPPPVIALAPPTADGGIRRTPGAQSLVFRMQDGPSRVGISTTLGRQPLQVLQKVPWAAHAARAPAIGREVRVNPHTTAAGAHRLTGAAGDIFGTPLGPTCARNAASGCWCRESRSSVAGLCRCWYRRLRSQTRRARGAPGGSAAPAR
jgi:hypothetical protein